MPKRDARTQLLSRLPVFQGVRDRLARNNAPEKPIPNIPTLAEFVRDSWHVLEGDTKLDWNWHIEAMAVHAQELMLDWLRHKKDPSYEQRFQNFLINIPPGSMKSRTISVCLPAWFWLHCPGWRAMFLTANPRVAVRDSLFCRDLIASTWYQETFKPSWKLRYDQNTKTLFSNTAGGYRQALGWNSRIIGARADALIIDDPQDAEEAASVAKRQTVIDRWDNAIGNRVNDLRTSVRLAIMQRLREDDWAAHVLDQGWRSLVIQQEFEGPREPTPIGWVDPRKEIGELMCPDRFPTDILAGEKLRLGSGYAGQHQQRPTAAGGGVFKVGNWMLYNPNKPPKFRRSMLSVDANFKAGNDSDYAVISSISESADFQAVPTVYKTCDRDTGEYIPTTVNVHKYYVRDRWRGKVSYPQLKAALQEQAKKHSECSIVLVEQAANGHAILDDLKGVIQGLQGYKPGTDSKISRASAIAPAHEGRQIYLPIAEWAIATLEGMGLDEISIDDWWAMNPPVSRANAEHTPVAEWVKEWINEFAMFPNGANDDQVDTLSQAILWARANNPQEIKSAAPRATTNDPIERRKAMQATTNDRLRRQRNIRGR